MSRESIELDQRVLTALDVYQPARREEILDELWKLVENPTVRYPVLGLPPSERLYAIDTPAGPRLIYRIDEDGQVIELVDYFRPWFGPAAHREPAPPPAPGR